MKTRIDVARIFAAAIMLPGATMTMAAPPRRPQGPCDIYGAAGTPCVAAHSTTRSLYASYNGPLYQVKRQSDGKTLDIGIVKPGDAPSPDAGGYAGAAAQDAFQSAGRIVDHGDQIEPFVPAPPLRAQTQSC